MKTLYNLLSSMILAVLAITVSGQSTDMESAKTSVVKIKTNYLRTENGKAVKDLGVATGWCWNEPTLVVTALHAVTGANEITVYRSPGQSTNAVIIKVLKEADLALLRLNTDLGLKPLQLQETDPNSSKELYVWGFPHSVHTMQGDEIRLSRSMEKSPTLNSILTGNKLKMELEEQGYPLPAARILRISSTIQPGHSGAPIMTSTGNVVGIADGGLRGGAARINWAMPAQYYVPRLGTSNDPIPSTASVQVSLYSNRTTVDADASEEAETQEIAQETKQNTVQNGEQSVTLTWTASYEDIFSTMAPEDQKDLIEITQSLELNMSDATFDIYEDYETGASIAIPGNAVFEVQDGWFYTANHDESLIFDALPFISESYTEAKESVYGVYLENYPETEWLPDPNSGDEVIEEDEYEEASYFLTRIAADGSGRTLYFMAEVSGPDLLVINLEFEPALFTSAEYLKEFLHFTIATELCTFGEY